MSHRRVKGIAYEDEDLDYDEDDYADEGEAGLAAHHNKMVGTC